MLPNLVFGLGGAGKEILFTILEQEWILRKVVADRRDGRLGESIKAVVIDSATDEYPEDLKWQEEIEDKARNIIESEGLHLNVEDVLDLRVMCIPKETNITRVSDLISVDVARKVKNSDDLRNVYGLNNIVWWLEDPDNGLKGWFEFIKTLDRSIDTEFKRGVFRKRAIGKAMFYKLLSEKNVLDIETPTHVAIFVGLGGGTGSSIFLDLANWFNKKHHGSVNIDLFGVLPTQRELNAEKANAFVALTELEYLRVKDERIFQSVLLLPFDPTGYVSSMDSSSAMRDKVREFDVLMTYIFYNFYVGGEVGGANLFDEISRLKYASFLIATGNVVRYEVKNLLEIKNLAKSSVETLKESISREEDTRKEIDEILQDFSNVLERVEKTPLKDNFDYLNSVVERTKLWNYRVFDILKYSSINEIKESIEYALTSSSSTEEPFENLVNNIEVSERVLDDIRTSTKFQPKDELDRQIPEVLHKAFQTFKMASNQIKVCTAIEFDETLRRFIEKLIRFELPSASEEAELERYVSSLSKKVSDIKEELSQTEKEESDIESQIEDIRNNVKDLILETNDTLNELWKTEELYEESDKALRKLDREIGDYISQLKSRFLDEVKAEDKYYPSEEEWLNKVGFRDLENTIKEYLADLEEIQSTQEVVAINKSVLLTYYYKNMVDYYNHKLSNMGKLSQKVGKDKKFREWRKSFETKLSEHSNELDDSEFVIHYDSQGVPERVEFSSLILGRVAKERDKTIDSVIDKFARMDAPISDSMVKKMLDRSDDRDDFKNSLREELVNLIIENKGTEKAKQEIQERKSEINERLGKNEQYYNVLNNFYKEYSGIRRNIETKRDLWNKFSEYTKKVDEKLSERDVWVKEKYAYLFKISPDASMVGALGGDISSLRIDDILNSDMLNSETLNFEIDRIVNKCKSCIDKVSGDVTYRGIDLPYIEFESAEGIRRWSPSLVYLGVNGCRNIVEKVMEEESIKDAINMRLELTDRDNVNLFVNEDAYGQYDTAVLLYTIPVFTEYIANVRGDKGYKAAYDKTRGKMVAGKEIPNILHHALMLEEGKIVRRAELMDLKKAAEVAKNDYEGRDIAGDVLNFYKVIPLVNAHESHE